jgi:ankyrin repeat protein
MAPLHVAVEMENGGGRGGLFGNGARGASIDPPNETSVKEVIQMLVDRGANPNQQMFFRAPRAPGSVSSGARGTTPFMRACASGDVELVKLLLAHGADVHLREADDETPMMLALTSRRGEDNIVEMLRVLHAAGADVNVVAKYHHLQRTRGGSALHVAVRLGLKKAMAELVSYGIDVNAKDPDGLTALDYAMARGYVPFLGQREPARLDLAKMLRDWGANVELANTPDWPPVGPPIGYEATIWAL